MGVRTMLGTGLAVALLAAPAAAAQTPTLDLDHGIAPDGGGTLIATVAPAADAQIAWARCVGGGPVCAPYPSDPGGRRLEAGDSAPGTTFEATVTVDGREVVRARSGLYLGRVRWTEPPGIAGRLRANGFVRPVPAKWTGGWGDERSYPQLQVCRDERARRCLVISDAFHWNRCPRTGAVIARRYAGWYLRAVDRRNASSVPRTLVAFRMPEAIPPVSVFGPVTAVTPVVPIAPAAGPPKRGCGKGERPSRDQLRDLLRRNTAVQRGGR